MQYVLYFLMLSLPAILFAQGKKDTVTKKTFTYVEQLPVAPFNIKEYLGKNLHYPEKALKKGIHGKVIVRFVVNEDGSLSNFKIVQGIGGGCNKEALRVVRNMPAWQPGKQNGKVVKTILKQPINFEIPEY